MILLTGFGFYIGENMPFYVISIDYC